MFVLLLCLGLISEVYGASVDITSVGGANQATLNTLAGYVNANSELQNLDQLHDLARGMADANAAAAHAGTIFGYQNYEIFAVSAGFMSVYQLPNLGDNASEALEDDVREDGDVYAGAGVGVAWVNVGVNLGWLLENTYLSFKFGTLDVDEDDLMIDSKLFGMGINYTLIPSVGLGGLVSWRGISLGTGFIYHKTEIEYELDFDASYTEGTYSYDLKPRVNTDMYTVTIPVEISTSFQLFWLLNISGGAGVDFNFGSADVTLIGGEVKDDSGNTVGIVHVNGTNVSDESPSSIRPRLMAALGLNLGPAKIDVPVYYYIPSGFAVGVTVGAVF
jgi:hypothetical protein